MRKKLGTAIGMFIRKNTSAMLTLGALVGVGTTIYSCVRDTHKADILISQATHEKEAPLTVKEKTPLYAVSYIPTAISASVTVGCIITGHIRNTKIQRSLVSSSVMATQAFNEYRKKACEVFGEDADRKITLAVSEDKFGCWDGKAEILMEKRWFYEPWSDRFFQATPMEVQNAEYHLNRNLALRGYVELNELYEFLGLEPTENGMVNGWSVFAGEEFYGYSFIDFEHIYRDNGDPDTPPYYEIHTPFWPHADFMDY